MRENDIDGQCHYLLYSLNGRHGCCFGCWKEKIREQVGILYTVKRGMVCCYSATTGWLKLDD